VDRDQGEQPRRRAAARPGERAASRSNRSRCRCHALTCSPACHASIVMFSRLALTPSVPQQRRRAKTMLILQRCAISSSCVHYCMHAMLSEQFQTHLSRGSLALQRQTPCTLLAQPPSTNRPRKRARLASSAPSGSSGSEGEADEEPASVRLQTYQIANAWLDICTVCMLQRSALACCSK